MKIFYSLIVLFNVSICFSQNERDKRMGDLIKNQVLYEEIEKEDYFTVKNELIVFENEFGYEPSYHFRLLLNSYNHRDIAYYKTHISILVEKYGYNVSNLKGTESYYQSIIYGDLSKWFKKMYLKKHFDWLDNNFEKQVDLQILNDLKSNDQFISNSIGEEIKELKLDSVQTKKIDELSAKYYLQNLLEIEKIVKKRDIYPNDKNFALIQNGIDIVEFHNFQVPDNFEKTYNVLFNYYKKAYLKNEIRYSKFLNIDYHCYQNFGYQKFGLIKISNLQKWQIKSETDPPIQNLEFQVNLKKEFKWF